MERVRKQKAAALKVARQCLKDLEVARPDLPPREYEILRTRLLSNEFQLQVRGQMILAALHYRQIRDATTTDERRAALKLYDADVAEVRKLADALPAYGEPRAISYLGKTYTLYQPLGMTPKELNEWLTLAED